MLVPVHLLVWRPPGPLSEQKYKEILELRTQFGAKKLAIQLIPLNRLFIFFSLAAILLFWGMLSIFSVGNINPNRFVGISQGIFIIVGLPGALSTILLPSYLIQLMLARVKCVRWLEGLLNLD